VVKGKKDKTTHKHEEMRTQQTTLKQETKSHIQSWAQVVKGKTRPPLGKVKEVVQAKLREEHTKRARELNLKIKGLPLPLPSPDPIQVGTIFLRDNLDLSNITLESAWFGTDSTLFIWFRSTGDRLRALRAKRRLFSLPNRIFLDEDLTQSQVAELKHSRESIVASTERREMGSHP
jgi:hypothetical protein